MIIREARELDIEDIMLIRASVKENKLWDPDAIPSPMVKDYLFIRGKGWVCEIESKVVGFSIIDIVKSNIWALFVNPNNEGLGIGKQLFNTMLKWYFSTYNRDLWLTTEKGTRAEQFYRKSGWTTNNEILPTGEVRFTLTKNDWQELKG